MNKRIALQQTNTPPGVEFGYISSIMSWQGLVDDYRTYCGIVCFSKEGENV